MILLSEYILDHEWKPLRRHFSLEDIVLGGEKVLKNLAIPLKPLQKQKKNITFYKVRIGKRGKGRMIVFVVIGSSKVVPLLIRLKKDKIFGMNMALNNPAVVQQMNRNFDRVLEDIEKKRYKVL